MRIFRFTGAQNMEKIVSIDKELTKYHRAEVVTDDATVILRRAVKLAQQGFIVSVGTPLKLDEFTEEKKNAVEQIAKDRNMVLSKCDPARPFISSPVANSMACELIALIHSLFKSSTASVWETAINDFISDKLACLSNIAVAQDTLFSGTPLRFLKFITELEIY
jgi:E3 ubiquitin-protein ligase HECTD4